MTSLGWPIPAKPASFTPEGAPAGVEVRFVEFWQTRPMLRDPLRSAFVHTNGADGEGSIDSAWNWAHAKPGSNTCPHYQVDRTHNGVTRARKMLPSNRRAIANATVDAYQDGHGDVAWWSLAIETADEGWGPGRPGGACGFDDRQGELIATILAYEAVVSPALPLRLLDEWFGSGLAGHTDPFGYPYTTLARGKACPGDAKKRDMREWIIPRAAAIHRVWTAPPPTPTPTPGGLELTAMYQIALQMQQGTLICRVTADAVIHETNGVAAEVDTAAGVKLVPVSRAQFLGLLAGGRRTVGDPFAVWPDPELAAAWKARRG